MSGTGIILGDLGSFLEPFVDFWPSFVGKLTFEMPQDVLERYRLSRQCALGIAVQVTHRAYLKPRRFYVWAFL